MTKPGPPPLVGRRVARRYWYPGLVIPPVGGDGAPVWQVHAAKTFGRVDQRRFTVGLLIVISAVCLVLSSTSLWTRRHVVNTEVFVAGGQAILADPAVQGAINTKVVDTIMANPEVQGAVNDVVALLPPRLQTLKPAVEDGARNLLSSGVHAVLTSDRFSILTATALTSVQTQLLTGQPVSFTLGQAKARIPQQDRTGLAGQVVNLIPDNVGFTVLTPQQAPSSTPPSTCCRRSGCGSGFSGWRR